MPLLWSRIHGRLPNAEMTNNRLYGNRLYLRPGRVRVARLVSPHRHSGLFGITAPDAEGKQQQDEPVSGR